MGIIKRHLHVTWPFFNLDIRHGDAPQTAPPPFMNRQKFNPRKLGFYYILLKKLRGVWALGKVG